MQISDTIFVLIIILFSAVVHEVMHGVAADKLGDPTARYAGRLTLNPFVHLDLFGSVLLPLLLAFGGAPILFGYAKPVPYNPYNLRPGRWSEAIVAAAGPLSNLAIALVFGLCLRLLSIGGEIGSIFFLVVAINTTLCIFNLFPVPPFDGSKILPALLPRRLDHSYERWRLQMEHFPFLGMMLVLFVVMILGSTYSDFIYSIARVISGI